MGSGDWVCYGRDTTIYHRIRHLRFHGSGRGIYRIAALTTAALQRFGKAMATRQRSLVIGLNIAIADDRYWLKNVVAISNIGHLQLKVIYRLLSRKS